MIRTEREKLIKLIAKASAGDAISFGIKAPLNAVFDTTTKAYKNKGVLDELLIKPGEDGLWHVSAKTVKHGTVTLPFTVNGRLYKAKIRIKK